MASEDIHIVPPVDDSEEALDIFFQQLCETINYATNHGGSDGLGDHTDIPPDVTGLIAVGGYGTNKVYFDPVSYAGHSATLIVRATDGNVNNAVAVGTTSTDIFSDSIANPDAGVTYTYWAKNLNIYGTQSLNYSNPATCVLSVDVDYAIDTLLGKLGYDEFKVGSFPVRCVDSLPLLPDADWPIGSYILLTTSSETYENVANAWVVATNVPFDSNALVAGKVAAGALVVDDAVIQDLYVNTGMIKDLAITSAKIDTLDAAKINVGTLTGFTIQTNASPTTSGGVIQSGNHIRVYDDSGVLRVELGELL